MRDIQQIDRALSELTCRQRRRRRLLFSGSQGAHTILDGQLLLSFASNDYLGLANHPALRMAMIEAVEKFGVGAGASHLLTGHHECHHQLECALADFVEQPSVLLFSTGYMANLAVLTSLLGRNDDLFSDKLNHASLVDGAVLCRSHHYRYRHGDMDHLESLLRASTARTKVVATDAVFSMDGDVAPVLELISLAERYEAWLLLDDAHGFGVLGAEGRGILSYIGAPSSERVIYMATLGKAAGVSGAFVAGPPSLVDWLVNTARTYIYTTAMPPALAAATMASLKLVKEDSWRRERLSRHIERLKQAAENMSWKWLASKTPIQPVLVGKDANAVHLSEALLEKGILVPAIRPPTVPEGGARLRISLSAGHADEDLDRLIAVFNQVKP